MVDAVVFTVTVGTALGCGLIAGVFFAFSSFVMTALSRRPPHEAMAAMQAINVVVLNAWFLGVFLGTAALCIGMLILAVVRWQESGSGYILLGSTLYLAGTFGVTVIFNVPRNDGLAALDPADPGSPSAWQRYRVEWTWWNHVRTAAALGALASFCGALAQ